MSGKPNDKWLSTMIQKHGSREAVAQVMQQIGAKGGKAGNTGGFAANVDCECPMIPTPHFIRHCAGARGGSVSRRGKKSWN